MNLIRQVNMISIANIYESVGESIEEVRNRVKCGLGLHVWEYVHVKTDNGSALTDDKMVVMDSICVHCGDIRFSIIRF